MLRHPAALAAIGKPAKLCSLVYLNVNHNNGQSKSTNVDAIDSFTNDLVTRKSAKWKQVQQKILTKDTIIAPIGNVKADQLKLPMVDKFTGQWRNSAVKLLQELTNLRDVELELDLRKLTQKQVDHLLINAMLDDRKKNFYEIVEQCIQVRRLPSELVVFDVLNFFTQSGELKRIEDFARLIQTANEDLFFRHDGFSHFRARCLWQQGHSALALDELKKSYTNMRALRLIQMPVTLLRFFREVVEDTVEQRQNDGEELLRLLMDTAQHLSNVFGENQVLTFVWQSCFLSDLFNDQQMAVQMFGENEDVQLAVRQRTSTLAYTLLQDHNVDAVHRLIELMLRFDMRLECKSCLTFLFEYQYWRRDLRACSEIIRNSLDINLPLADIYNQKLLSLLLGGNANNAAVGKRPKTHTESETFKLRF